MAARPPAPQQQIFRLVAPPPVVSTLNHFDPSEAEFSIWLRQFNEFCYLNNIEEEPPVVNNVLPPRNRRRALFLSHIGSRAFQVLTKRFSPNEPNIFPIDILAHTLIQHYEKPELQGTYRLELSTRIQKHNESLQEYSAELQALGAKCGYAQGLDERLRECFLSGANLPTHVRQHLLENPQMIFDEMVHYALNQEMLAAQTKMYARRLQLQQVAIAAVNQVDQPRNQNSTQQNQNKQHHQQNPPQQQEFCQQTHPQRQQFYQQPLLQQQQFYQQPLLQQQQFCQQTHPQQQLFYQPSQQLPVQWYQHPNQQQWVWPPYACPPMTPYVMPTPHAFTANQQQGLSTGPQYGHPGPQMRPAFNNQQQLPGIKTQQTQQAAPNQAQATNQHPNSHSQSHTSTCMRCGGSHERSKCFAADLLCNFCKTKGHISRVCRKKASQSAQVNNVDNQNGDPQPRETTTISEAGQYNYSFPDSYTTPCDATPNQNVEVANVVYQEQYQSSEEDNDGVENILHNMPQFLIGWIHEIPQERNLLSDGEEENPSSDENEYLSSDENVDPDPDEEPAPSGSESDADEPADPFDDASPNLNLLEIPNDVFRSILQSALVEIEEILEQEMANDHPVMINHLKSHRLQTSPAEVVTIVIDKIPVQMEIDCGAGVSIMPHSTFSCLLYTSDAADE